MAKILFLYPQAWDCLEGITLYAVYAIAALALARYGPDHLQALFYANLPGLSMLVLSVLRERFESRRWR